MHLMGRSLGTLLVEQTSLARPGMDFAPQSFVIDSAKSVVHRKTAGEEKGEINVDISLFLAKAWSMLHHTLGRRHGERW